MRETAKDSQRQREIVVCGSEPTESDDAAPIAGNAALEGRSITRRRFIEGGAIATTIWASAAILGTNMGRQMTQGWEVMREKIWDQRRENGEAPDPMQVGLAVVALNAADIEPVKSQNDIRSEVAEQTRRISATTGGQFAFKINYHEEDESPDSTEERDGQSVPVYSHEQMMNIARRYDTLGRASMVLLMVNSADSAMGDDVYAGRAIRGASTLTAVVRSHVAGGNTIGHEIGHMLNPYVLGPGMDHEKVITTNLGGESERPRQKFAFDTIQKLITDGACELARQAQNPAAVNEYASTYTIMGDFRFFSERETENQPVFSSAEQLFLCPSLRSTLATGPGCYGISVEKGKNFAVRMKLPEDHVLHQLVPGAEELVFGALEGDRLKEDGTKVSPSIKAIGPFVTYNKGRGTVFLDLGFNVRIDGLPPEAIGESRHGWDEHAIYADEQLNIVAVAGTDKTQRYVRLLQLDTPQGQHFLSTAQQIAYERNEMIMKGYR